MFAAGAAALRREASALDLSESSSSSSLRWADDCSALPREPGAADGRSGNDRSGKGRGRGRGRRKKVLCRPLLPFALRLEARHGGIQASGWWSTTGFVLREPAKAAFDLTPALVGGVLARINPLLAGAIRLREDDAVRISLWPMSDGSGGGGGGGGHLPASAIRIDVRPLRLQMEPNALVAGSLRLVSGYNRASRALLLGVGGGGGRGGKKETASPSSPPPSPSPPPPPSSSFFGKLVGNRGSKSSSGSKNKNVAAKKPRPQPREATLEAWTSSLSATLLGGGRGSKGFWVDSGRLDMLISKSGFAASGAKAPGTAHVAAWGIASLLPETGAAVRARAKQKLARERAREKEKKREGKKEKKEKKRKEKGTRSGSGGGSGGAGGEGEGDDWDSSSEGEAAAAAADDDPSTSGLRMTLALMSDCLGLPPSPSTNAPWPAVRVAVSGTALQPRIGWLGATRDAAALLLPGRRLRRRSAAAAAAAASLANSPVATAEPAGDFGGPSSFSGGGSPLLPWESHLQRSGGSRREDTVGAPLGPSVAGRLERSEGKFSGARRSSPG